jgi:hypothetical protein
MSDQLATQQCSSCGDDVECCEFCENPGCKAATCYDCLNMALGQAKPQPHDHGG